MVSVLSVMNDVTFFSVDFRILNVYNVPNVYRGGVSLLVVLHIHRLF